MANMSDASKFIKTLFFVFLFVVGLLSSKAFAEEPKTGSDRADFAEGIPKRTLFDLPKTFKEGRMRFLPIPVFDTDPGSGQRYGLMPTFLFLDKKEELVAIAVAAMTYNPKVVKWGGYAGFFLYPSTEEKMRLFYQVGERFERDYYLQYINESWFDGRFSLDTEIEYFQNPFERFFGFGPNTTRATETNFVSHVWFWKGKFGYEIFPKFDIQLEEKWTRLQLRPHAILTLRDTATVFAGNPEVKSSDQWNHRLSFIWDTRDSNDFPTDGHYVETFGLFSHEPFNSNTFYSGYGFWAKEIFTLAKRFTTNIFFRVEQDFGESIPFYMQPSLGGEATLRAFVERRFTGRGRILLDVEERIVVKTFTVNQVKFDLSLDPFFAVGQVFDNWSEVRFGNLQPVVGMGFRAKVPPSVLGRVDVGYGSEGLQVYTGLDYPF